MATPKVKGLLFDGWWADHVVKEEGARILHKDLYRDYCDAVARPMGPQAFITRMNEMRIPERKEKRERYRLGVRLRREADGEAGTTVNFPGVVTPEAARASAQRAMLDAKPFVRTQPAGEVDTIDLNIVFPSGLLSGPQAADDDGIYRIAPYTGGPAVRCVVLEADSDEDLASALVARSLYRARVRQRAPVAEGGEGFSNADDDRYGGQLAFAASAYAYAAGQPEEWRAFLELNGKPERTSTMGWHVLELVRRLWPWDRTWWKPKTPLRDLERAGALVIAAYEQLQRAEARARLSAEEQRLATGV